MRNKLTQFMYRKGAHDRVRTVLPRGQSGRHLVQPLRVPGRQPGEDDDADHGDEKLEPSLCQKRPRIDASTSPMSPISSMGLLCSCSESGEAPAPPLSDDGEPSASAPDQEHPQHRRVAGVHDPASRAHDHTPDEPENRIEDAPVAVRSCDRFRYPPGREPGEDQHWSPVRDVFRHAGMPAVLSFT